MRVEALPKGDPNDNDNLRKFASAVLVGRADRDRRAGLDPEIRRHRGATPSSTPASMRCS